jgi:hypothetical protein
MHIHRPAGPCGLAVASTYKTGAHQQRYAIGSYQNVPCLGHMGLKGAQKITFPKTTAPKEWCWTLQPQLLQLGRYSLSGNSRAKKRSKTDPTSISAGLSLPYPDKTQPSRERAQQTTLGVFYAPSSTSTAALKTPTCCACTAADQRQQRKTSRWLYLAGNTLPQP